MGIRIPDRLGDSYETMSINRIPPGYTVYPTGKGDLLQASGYRAGDRLVFTPSDTTKRFRIMSPWYIIGGRLFWSGSDFNDDMEAWLKAPATSHAVNQAGDFNKYALGGGANMFVPASPGQGAWDLDIGAKYTGTNILKAVPVPVAGNTGFFDHDPAAQTLTVNASQTGGYNLYDFEATLICLAYSIFGLDGERQLDVADVIGKLLFPQWELELKLNTAKLPGTVSSAIVILSATKGNV